MATRRYHKKNGTRKGNRRNLSRKIRKVQRRMKGGDGDAKLTFDKLDGCKISNKEGQELYTIKAKDNNKQNKIIDNKDDKVVGEINNFKFIKNSSLNRVENIIKIYMRKNLYILWDPSTQPTNTKPKNLFSSVKSFFTGDKTVNAFKDAISFIYLNPIAEILKDKTKIQYNDTFINNLSTEKNINLIKGTNTIELKPCYPDGLYFASSGGLNQIIDSHISIGSENSFTDVLKSNSSLILTPAGFMIQNETSENNYILYYFFIKMKSTKIVKQTNINITGTDTYVSDSIYPLDNEIFKNRVTEYYTMLRNGKKYNLSIKNSSNDLNSQV